MLGEHYTREFYERLQMGAKRSAEIMVPLTLQIVPARSVVDVGCGDGSWLAVFRRLGVDEILGVDGDYVDRNLLQIPRECFQAFDLTKPFGLGRTFELAVSLEVAEHLPADSAAVFVESLTGLAPLVLFSAAIPFQGGEHHINEQWPDKWVGLFKEHDYLPLDFIRRQVWQNDAVEWWYAQNTLLFVRKSFVESNPVLKAELEQTNLNQLAVVHPRQYLHLHGLLREAMVRAEHPPPPSGVIAASRLLLVCLRNSFRNRFLSSKEKQVPLEKKENPVDSEPRS
jgi:SAM-dependent methyltransferase